MQINALSSESLLAHFERRLEDRPFRPPLWLRGGHLQTLAASLLKRNFSWGWGNAEELFVDLGDGSRVRLICAWQPVDAPTLVVLHGTGGSSASTYMQGLSHKAYREGWNAVLVNLYNTNPELPKPKVFHSGSSREVGELLQKLSMNHQVRKFFLAGVSMGGNILLKLMGEWGSDSLVDVRAAGVISPLVDLTTAWKVLERPSNFLFQHHFVKNFKKRIKRHRSSLSPFVDVEALLRIKTLRQFDQLFTAPLAGFRDAFDYYERASALPYLKDIRIPTLLIHSHDDPLLPGEPFTLSETRSNPSLLMGLTRQGGHVGYLEQALSGGDIDRFWAENRLIDFFRLARQTTQSRGL